MPSSHLSLHQQVRLSKGENLKDGWSDFILCEYDTGPDADLTDVEDVQQVRTVWDGEQWELHFVCKVAITAADSSGEKTAGVDIGICNTAAVSVGEHTLLCGHDCGRPPEEHPRG